MRMRKGCKLQSVQQQKEVIRLWAEGYTFNAICAYLKETYDITIAPQNIHRYTTSPKWADERKKAIAKAEADLDNIPIVRRSVRQRRRNDLYESEAQTVEEKRRLLYDAANDQPKSEQGATIQAVTPIQINLILEALDGPKLATIRAELERKINSLAPDVEGGED